LSRLSHPRREKRKARKRQNKKNVWIEAGKKAEKDRTLD
jgi:hypothetical protein